MHTTLAYRDVPTSSAKSNIAPSTTVKVFYYALESACNLGRVEIDLNADVYDLLRKIRDDIASYRSGGIPDTEWNLELYKVSVFSIRRR